MRCAWGEKALGAYLGEDLVHWEKHDSCELICSADRHLPMLVDQGSADIFLADQLRTPLLETACADAAYPATIRMQEGYDHSYFFIASFIDEHVAFHAQHCHD
jgi:S-formylglutathione hydrolase